MDGVLQKKGAVLILLLEQASAAIEWTTQDSNGLPLIAEAYTNELLVSAVERCFAATKIILDALFSRPDAVTLAWEWLAQIVAYMRLKRLPPANDSRHTVNFPLVTIRAVAERLTARPDAREWINRWDRLKRIHRLLAVTAVAAVGRDAAADRIASVMEWALLEGNFDCALLAQSMADSNDVVASVGGLAISLLPDPAGWFMSTWHRLRPIRERNWRAGPMTERNDTGELFVVWGLAALEALPADRRQLLWHSVELAIRDAWQTDTFGYGPHWSVALLRLFELSELNRGGDNEALPLSRALLPYINSGTGFISFVVELRRCGWSVSRLREAVSAAGFDLKQLVKQFLDAKDRVFKLPQADPVQIARYRDLQQELEKQA